MRLHDTTWLSLSALSRELGLGRKPARKALAKVAFCYPPVGDPPQWDARVLDLLRAIRSQPHRTLENAAADWLSRYLEGDPRARTTTQDSRTTQP